MGSNSLFTVLFAHVLFLWLGIFIEVDVDRITILHRPPPPPSHKWQLFEISARLKLVSVPFSRLVLDIGHLEKSFPEGIM